MSARISKLSRPISRLSRPISRLSRNARTAIVCVAIFVGMTGMAFAAVLSRPTR